MKKRMAFTLAEILIVVMLIGVLAMVMMKKTSTKGFEDKANLANAQKVFNNIQEAAVNILANEEEKCPAHLFITKIAGTYEYAIVKDREDEEPANTDDVLEIFSKYLRFEKNNLNFCEYSNYCESSNTSIKGGRLSGGNIYIGFEVFGDDELQDCPNEYYLPSYSENDSANKEISSELITKEEGTTGKCWGKVYVDVDGLKGKGELGKDVYVWGLTEQGLAY